LKRYVAVPTGVMADGKHKAVISTALMLSRVHHALIEKSFNN